MKRAALRLAMLIAILTLSLFALTACEWLFDIKKEPTIEVRFVYNNGQNDSVINIKSGEAVPLPLAPVLDGYAFGAWYADANFTERYMEGSRVYSSLTLYAGYVRIYTLSGGIYDYYDYGFCTPLLNAGTINGMGKYAGGSKVALSTTLGTEYAFAEWYKNGVFYSNQESIVVTVSGDDVYDVKVRKTLSLSVGFKDIAGGTIKINGKTDSTVYVVEGTNVSLSAKPNAGFTFDGWYKEGNLFTTDSQFGFELRDDMVFYAKFSYIDYTVSVLNDVPEKGNLTVVPEKAIYRVGETVSLSVEVESDYLLEGIYLKNNGAYRFLTSVAGVSFSIVSLIDLSGGATVFEFKADYIFADNATDCYVYETINEGSAVKITGITGEFASGHVFVPAYLGGLPVRQISASAFYGHGEITHLYLPDTLTSFYGNANPFMYCPNIEYITVAAGNTAYFGDANGVLYDKAVSKIISYPRASILTSYTAPNTVTRVEPHAFDGVKNVQTVTLGRAVEYIGAYAFKNSEVKNINVNSSALSFIADMFAFSGAVKLESVSFRLTGIGVNYASEIKQWAFSGCKKLASVIFDGIKTLNEELFSDCPSLVNISLSSSVNSLVGDVFGGAANLQNIYAAANSLYFESAEGALYNKQKTLIRAGEGRIAEINAKDGTIAVGEFAFKNCARLIAVYLCDSVRTIGASAFSGATTLNTIYMGSGVTTIGDYAFYNCASLLTITLSNTVLTLGEYTFGYCAGLTSIYLGLSLTHTKASTFTGCSSLATISFPNTIYEMGDRNANADGELPLFMECDNLTEINVASGGAAARGYSSIDGVLYKGDDAARSEMLVRCPEAKTGTVWITSHNILVIANYAFYKSGVSAVKFNFTGAPVQPLTKIGFYAFAYAESITEISVPGSVRTISGNAFMNCKSLASVDLSTGVKTIERFAFAGCNLEEITLPSSITKMSGFIFSDNPRLNRVYVEMQSAPEMVLYNNRSYLFERHNASFVIYIKKVGGASNKATFSSKSGWSEYASFMTDWD
ncbi:MAG: leucine-rich repeat protein [Clostridiales bacterium]|jgi:hypothetical protein|nr:leucine-rich repeat protein [Clostridiales bacterium]